MFLHQWDREERKGGKGGREKLMYHDQDEAVLLNPQFWMPKAITTPKSSLKSTGHRNGLVERRFCGIKKIRDSFLCSHVGRTKRTLEDYSLVHIGTVGDFQSQDFYKAKEPLEFFRNLGDSHRIKYVRFQPIFLRSEEGLVDIWQLHT